MPDPYVAISSASPQAIASACLRLSMPGWLPPANRYYPNRRDLVIGQLQSGRFDADDLHEYMAASVPIHCFEGWAYFGRAALCHARADPYGAIHLGYYAELRGAMSLLASQGIGIFIDHHPIVDRLGRVTVATGPPTHKAVWEAFRRWANLPTARDLVMKVIQSGGVSLGDWLNAFGAATPTSMVAALLLENLGLDLKRFSEDRASRNLVSYGLNTLVPTTPLAVNDIASFLSDVWNSFEPSAGPFAEIDKHLLRKAFHYANSLLATKLSPSKLTERIVATIANVAPSNAASLTAFFTASPPVDEISVLRRAIQHDTVGDPEHHIQVLARAALLLRLATGTCADFLGTAGHDWNALQPWWKPIGETAGLWDAASVPGRMAEMWDDIYLHLERIQEWLTTTGATTSVRQWQGENGDALLALIGFERVCMWGCDR